MHLLNITIHIACGVAAMAIGFLILATQKGTARHRRLGRRFAWLTLTVCATGVVGNVLFRFVPLFAILTLLVLYQFFGAWRAVVTRACGPALLDAALTAAAALAGFILAPIVLLATEGSPPVIYSAFAALAVVIVYDICRWLFPAHWHASLWRYEHVYKAIATLFAMLSAASGNVIRFGQPWPQLLPSALGIATICSMMWITWRRQRGA